MSDDKVKILMWASNTAWYHDDVYFLTKEYDPYEPTEIIEAVVKNIFDYDPEGELNGRNIEIELPKHGGPRIVIKDTLLNSKVSIFVELMDRFDGCEIRIVYHDETDNDALFVTDELVHCDSLWDRLSSGSYAEDLKKLLSK